MPTINDTSILAANSSHHFWCKVETVHDAKYTALVSQAVVASYAMFFYIVVLFLSAVGTFCNTFRRLLSMQVSSILFLVGGLTISINIFGNADDESIYAKLYYRIPSGALVGIIFIVVGAWVFFENPKNHEQNNKTLGLQQPSMGLVVTTITWPLLLVELFLVFGTKAEAENETKDYKMIKTLLLTDKSLHLLQKLVQVVVYLLLRNMVVSENYRTSAKFYFKILAFFNFEEWLDSVINSDSDLKLTTADVIYGHAFEIIEMVYKALLIDYRLLCAVLFLEHALEVGHIHENENNEARAPVDTRCVVTARDQMKRNLGYLIGLLCIIARVLTAVNYIEKLRIGASVHVLAILVNVLIAVFGVVLLWKNNLSVEQVASREWKGVKIIVCCMGAVGFTCWMVKGALTALWIKNLHTAPNIQYFEWAAAKILTRGIGAAFLMVIYAKVNGRIIADRNQDVKINHFLVPALMLCVFSEAIGSAIDQYHGSVERTLRCVVTDQSLQMLLAAGPPMHLGFVIHVFLHFLVTQQMMSRAARANGNPARGDAAAPQMMGREALVNEDPARENAAAPLLMDRKAVVNENPTFENVTADERQPLLPNPK